MNSLLPRFRGSLDWIHEREDRAWAPSRPYWPGGESGVTLRPGVDLGYCERALVEKAYGPILTASELRSVRAAMGSRGEVAKMRCKTDRKLRQVRITYEEGREIFPHVAKDYWEGITRRFPALVSPLVPGAVHTALLSLAFNRGVWNGDLEQLRDKIQNREWGEMADAISSMQQNHSLKGIRVRRRLEGQKIRRAARLLALAEEIGELTPAGPVAL